MLDRVVERLVLLLLMAAVAGCSKGKLDELVDSAKKKAMESGEMVKQSVAETVDETVERASERLGQGKEVLNLAGDMQLTVGEPLSTKACYAKFLSVGAGRPNVLQLTSYQDAKQESFPSVFAQGQVANGPVESLVGQTIPADLFVQRESGQSVLFTELGSLVDLTVTAVDGQLITVEVAGQLHDAKTGTDIPVTGTLHGVLQ